MADKEFKDVNLIYTNIIFKRLEKINSNCTKLLSQWSFKLV